MSVNTLVRPESSRMPLAPFPPSKELGAQLRSLEKAQAEIDRCKAEELTRLRAIQDRD